MLAKPNGLGARVREARRERGMSQAQLAGEELTKGFISQVESNLVRPSVRSLQIIAARLGKSLDYFLGDAPLATAQRGPARSGTTGRPSAPRWPPDSSASPRSTSAPPCCAFSPSPIWPRR